MIARSSFVVALLLVVGCGSSSRAPVAPPSPVTTESANPATPTASNGDADVAAIKAAVNGPQRSEENRARDKYRHPAETLAFFGLKKDMTVLETFPGGGWYTEIVAPVVAEKGKLFVTSVDPNGPADKMGPKMARQLMDRFAAQPNVFGKVQVLRIDPPASFDLGAANSVDLVLVMRSIHDWVRDGDAEKILGELHRVLKPGGILGVEAHRGPEGTSSDPKVVGKSGYLSESFLKQLVEASGFTLVAKSEINANPNDTHEWPEGVWTLPPTLRLKDKDREKYVAVGESDRVTMKFVKK